MNTVDREPESVKQARESFNHVLNSEKYTDIIQDGGHLGLLLDLAGDGGYKSILDIGTGNGYLAFPLAEKFPSAHVCGIDIADEAVERNSALARERGIGNLSFRAFDGLRYPFEEGSFDLIVTRYAFHHFPKAQDAVFQMSRILSKGGRALISDPMRIPGDRSGLIDDFMRVKRDGHIQFFSSQALDSLFLSGGFRKEAQVMTDMRFPFPRQAAYAGLYGKLTEKERALYDMTDNNGVIWVNKIRVGNTVFVKE